MKGWTYKKSSLGFIESGYSLLFYQIDYFGDLFVCEWSRLGAMEWTQFTVEGDQFEVNQIFDQKTFSKSETWKMVIKLSSRRVLRGG